MKLLKSTNLFATVLIVACIALSACGKKITNVFPGSGGSSNYHGGGTPTNPSTGGDGDGGGGSADGGGGNGLKNSTQLVENLLEDEKERSFNGALLLTTLFYDYNLSVKADKKLKNFLTKIYSMATGTDQKTSEKCLTEIEQKNAYFKKKLVPYPDFISATSSSNAEQISNVDKANSSTEVPDLRKHVESQKEMLASVESERTDFLIKLNCANASFFDLKEKIKLKIIKKKECDVHGEAKDATIAFENEDSPMTICFSTESLSKMSHEDLNYQLQSLIIHEFVHMVGGGEAEAIHIQKYIYNFMFDNKFMNGSQYSDLIVKISAHINDFVSIADKYKENFEIEVLARDPKYELLRSELKTLYVLVESINGDVMKIAEREEGFLNKDKKNEVVNGLPKYTEYRLMSGILGEYIGWLSSILHFEDLIKQYPDFSNEKQSADLNTNLVALSALLADFRNLLASKQYYMSSHYLPVRVQDKPKYYFSDPTKALAP